MYARTSEDVDSDEDAELWRLESGADHTVQKQNATGQQQKLPAAQQHQKEKQMDSAELMRSGTTSGQTPRSGTVSSRKYSIIQNAGLSPAGQSSLLSTMQAAGSPALSSTFEERSPRGAAILTRAMSPADAFLFAESMRASKRQALLPAALAVEEDATARMQDLLLGGGQPPARQAESSSMPRAASLDPAPASVGGGLTPAQGLDSRGAPIPSSAPGPRAASAPRSTPSAQPSTGQTRELVDGWSHEGRMAIIAQCVRADAAASERVFVSEVLQSAQARGFRGEQVALGTLLSEHFANFKCVRKSRDGRKGTYYTGIRLVSDRHKQPSIPAPAPAVFSSATSQQRVGVPSSSSISPCEATGMTIVRLPAGCDRSQALSFRVSSCARSRDSQPACDG